MREVNQGTSLFRLDRDKENRGAIRKKSDKRTNFILVLSRIKEKLLTNLRMEGASAIELELFL